MGGLPISPYILPRWNGRSDRFEIRSLADLRHLPNLRHFGFSAMQKSTDLAPLVHLQKVEDLRLGMTGTWQNFGVLEHLPNLQAFSLFGHDLDAVNLAVVARLEARGVWADIF